MSSNKITFKNWLANIGKGLWQAICWVGRCLNPKYKTPFWRVIWSVLTICVIVCTCIITRVWYQAEREAIQRYGINSESVSNLYLSSPDTAISQV